jgi:hypothetical protein
VGAAVLIALSSFEAHTANGSVGLQWATESEIDNAGFNPYRAESEDGKYIRINKSLIPAIVFPTKDASYSILKTGIPTTISWKMFT